jgi:flavin-dependent dehydrogenase
MRFNVIVIGAGAAGCVLAARLREGAEWIDGTSIAIPAAATEVQHGRV